jgi:hypothetical protein
MEKHPESTSWLFRHAPRELYDAQMVTQSPCQCVPIVTARPEFGEILGEKSAPGNKVAKDGAIRHGPGRHGSRTKTPRLSATLWRAMCYIGCGRDGG